MLSWKLESYFQNARRLAASLVWGGVKCLLSKNSTLAEKEYCLTWFSGVQAPIPIDLCCELIGINKGRLFDLICSLVRKRGWEFDRWAVGEVDVRGVRHFVFRDKSYYNLSDWEAKQQHKKIPVNNISPEHSIIYLYFGGNTQRTIIKKTGLPEGMVQGVVNLLKPKGERHEKK